jgi:hypothetical protein
VSLFGESEGTERRRQGRVRGAPSSLFINGIFILLFRATLQQLALDRQQDPDEGEDEALSGPVPAKGVKLKS